MKNSKGLLSKRLLTVVLVMWLAMAAMPAALTAAVTVTTATLPTGYVGTSYSTTLAATGGATPVYTWSLASGSLAGSGLSLSTSGILAGTPTAATSYSLSIRATDSTGASATRSFTLQVSPAITVTTGALPLGVVGTAYLTTTLAATAGIAPYTWTITSGTLTGTGLTMSSAGVISGTPTTAGTSSITVRATDATGRFGSRTLSLTVNVALRVNASLLPSAVQGRYYTTQITSTGGSGGNVYSISAGALPPGLTLSASSGVISGTATAAGSYSFTVRAVDSYTNSATRSFSMAVTAPLTTNSGNVTISPPSIPTGLQGSVYSIPLSAGGTQGPAYTFILDSGVFPAGVSISSAGLISGVPSENGTFNFVIRATDNGTSEFGTQPYSLIVFAPVTLTAPANALQGLPYSSSVLASGGAGGPYTFTLSGSLPPGLSMASTGLISGTAAAPGSSTFTVTAQDGQGNFGSQQFTITVDPAPLQLLNSSLSNGTLNFPYKQTLYGFGGTNTGFTYSITSGSLPAGLSLNPSTGDITGSPTVFNATTPYTFTATVTDSAAATASAIFSLNIDGYGVLGLRFKPALLDETYIGNAAIGPAFSIWNVGGAASGTLSAVLDDAVNILGAGVSWSANGIGNAQQASAFCPEGPYCRLMDSYLVANPGSTGTITLSGFAPSSAWDVYLYTQAPVAGRILTASVNGSTPVSTTAGVLSDFGFVLNRNYLVIQATANVSGNIVITFGGAAEQDLNAIQLIPHITTPLSVTTSSLPGASQGVAYSQTLAATGATGQNFTWFVTAGSLPAGLALNQNTGAITGTPTGSGLSNFTVQVTDALNFLATRALSINVTGAPALSVTTASLPVGVQGASYTTTLSASGGVPPYTWSLATGNLPGGVTLTSLGVLSGTPASSGAFVASYQVTDSLLATAQATLTLTVNPPVTVTTATLANASVGVAYSQTLAATGGIPPYTWTQLTGTLPAGLTLNGSTGVISGTPTTAGSAVNMTFRATDSALTTGASTALGILVQQATSVVLTKNLASPSTLSASLTLTATMTPTGATGQVVFYDGSTILGIRTLTAGIATLTTKALGAGPHRFRAYYRGAGATLPSTSAVVSHTINSRAVSSFFTGSTFATGAGPRYLFTGDYNGDGIPDLVTANYGSGASGSVSVLFENGSGSIFGAASVAVGSGPIAGASGDFNNDGKDDFLIANFDGNLISTIFGNANATFTPGNVLSTGGGSTNPAFIAVADFNLDGNADIAVANNGTSNISVLFGVGDGTFGGGVQYITGAQPTSIATGDFNGDGLTDLAVSSFSANNVSVFLGQVGGSFATGVTYGAGGTGPSAIAAADFNADGFLDLAVANNTSNNVGVLLGTGSGTFGAATATTVAASPSAISVGDYNGDGALDLFVSSNAGARVNILRGSGTGTFTNPLNVGSLATLGNFVGDFNQDGATDVVHTSISANTVNHFLGVGSTTTSLVSSLNPSTVGQTITLTATVSPSTATGTVAFKDGAATIGTATVSGGAAGLAVSFAAGTHSLTAVYSGDNTNQTSTSSVVSQVSSTPVTVTTTSLAPGFQNTAISRTITASGGTGPYTFAVTAGALPAGLTLSSGGVISGTPTATGTSTFTITATDSLTATGSQALTLLINSQTSVFNGQQITLQWDAPLGSTYGPPQTATVGTGYEFTNYFSGNTAFNVDVSDTQIRIDNANNGSAGPFGSGLFNGLVFTNPGGGSIPAFTNVSVFSTAWADSGGAQFQPSRVTFDATHIYVDFNGMTNIPGNTITLQINGISVTNTALPNSAVGFPYSLTLTAAGGTGTGRSFTVSSGSLPPGLTLNSSTGVISGSPTTAGTFTPTIQVTDSGSNTATRAYSVTIASGATINTRWQAAPLVSYTGPGVIGVSGDTWNSFSAGSGTAPLVGSTNFATPANITWAADNVWNSNSTNGFCSPSPTPFCNLMNGYLIKLSGATGNITYSGLTPNAQWDIYLYQQLDNGGSRRISIAVNGGTPVATTTNNLATDSTFILNKNYLVATATTNGSGQLSINYTGVGPDPEANINGIQLRPHLNPVVISQTSLPAGVALRSYSTTLTASGGTGTGFLWSVLAGNLPAGLTLNSSTGALTGSPSVAGTFSFTVQVTDSQSNLATQAYTLLVNPALAITTSTLPGGAQGASYNQTIGVTGGSGGNVWTISSGALPTGLNLSTSTGAITGTPTVAGTFSFTARVTDSGPAFVQQSFTVIINTPLTITTSSLPAGAVGQFYNQTLASTGGVPTISWSITSGSLQAGLTLNSSTGAITGNPSASGVSTITFTATDSGSGVQSVTLSLTINPALTITTTSPLPPGVQGVAYSQTILASGGLSPQTFSLKGGTLPPGVTLSSAGVLSGTPTTPGTFAFDVRVTDPGVTAERSFSLTIAGPVSITTATVPNGSVGIPYSVQLIGSGGSGVGTAFSIASGSLPSGLALTPATGVIAGTPTVAGSSTFTVQVTDNTATTASQTYTVAVAAFGLLNTRWQAPTVSPYIGRGVIGSVTDTWNTFSIANGSSVLADNASNPTSVSLAWSADGIFNSSSISPNAFCFPSPNAFCQLMNGYLFKVGGATANVTYSGLPPSTQWEIFLYQELDSGSGRRISIAVNGGAPVATTTGNSSADSTFILNKNYLTTTATTTAGGVLSIDYRGVGTDGEANINGIQIRPAVAPPQITTSSLVSGIVGVSYSVNLAATGGTGTGFNWTVLSGALPSGVTLNSGTGGLVGTPSVAGTFSFTIQVTDSQFNTGSRAFNLLISPALSISTAALPGGAVGESYAQSLSATGGSGGYSWSITGGSLPAGVNLNSSTGLISGTPTASGTAAFTVQVLDSGSRTATQALSIVVNPALTITSTSPLPNGVQGVAYSNTLAATGGLGTLTWSLASGSLPPGINLNFSTGALTGTPTAAGSYSFTIGVSDPGGANPTRLFSLTIAAPLSITTNLPTGVLNALYPSVMAATGGIPPYTWSVFSGTTPQGLALNPSTGAFAGSPSSARTFSFTLRVTDSATNTANRAYSVSINPALSLSTAFRSAGPFAAGSGPFGISTGDYNGDSKPDVAVADYSSGRVSVLLGDGVGGFTAAPGSPFTAGPQARRVESADINGDGKLDLLVANGATNTINVLLGNGLGGFTNAPGSPISVTGSPYSVRAGDLNGDGFADLAVANNASGNVTILLGNGAGAFTAGTPVSLSSTPEDLAIADLNADGKADLAVTLTGSNSIAVFLGTGLATFTAASGSPFAAGATPTSIIAADMNADGNLDLVTVHGNSGTSVLLGNGLGGFTAAPGSPFPVVGHFIDVADLDGDGKPDVATAHQGTGGLNIGLNNGSGVLTAAPGNPFGAGPLVQGVAIADFNADGKRDVAVSLGDTNNLVLLTGTGRFLAAPSLPTAVQGASYNVPVPALGGIPGYTYSVVTGALPAGLSYDSSGILTGTPSVTGSFSFTLRAQDSAGNTTSQARTLTVVAPVSITTATLNTGAVNQSYSQTLAATGGLGTYTWTLNSGLLPAGLTLNPAGQISGVPAAPGAATFTLRATDTGGNFSTVTLTLTVNPLLTFTSATLPAAVQGALYSFNIPVTGGFTPYAFSLATGTLPGGLTLSPAGLISGTPNAAGPFTFAVQVTDAGLGTAAQSFTLTVNPPVSITTSSLTATTLGGEVVETLTATGGIGPYTWSLAPGSTLTQAGLSLSSAGVLSGFPNTFGRLTVSLIATDSQNNTGTRTLTLQIARTGAATSDFIVSDVSAGRLTRISQSGTNALTVCTGANCHARDIAVDSQGNIFTHDNTGIYKITPGGVVTTVLLRTGGVGGVALDASGNIIFVDNSSDTVYRVTQAGVLTTVGALPIASPGSLQDAYVAVESSGNYIVLSSDNGALKIYRFTPAGLATTLATFSGDRVGGVTIRPSGTIVYVDYINQRLVEYTPGGSTNVIPVAIGETTLLGIAIDQPSGAYVVGGRQTATINRVTPSGAVTNLVAGTPFSGPVSIAAVPLLTAPQITSTALPPGLVGQSYTAQLTASGGSGNFTWTATNVPPGLAVSSSGAVTGGPTAAGTFTLRPTATDALNSQSVTANVTIVIASPVPPLSISGSTGQVSVAVGGAVSASFSAVGGVPPYTYTSSGLPPGVSIGGAGAVSGSASAAGVYNATIGVADTSGRSASTSLTVTVLGISVGSLPTGTVGVRYGGAFSGVGGLQPYRFSGNGLPPGISVDSSGNIAGIPTANGSFSASLTVTDSGGATISTSVNIVILAPGAPVTIVSGALPEATVNVPYSAGLAATGGRSPFTWALLSGAVPDGTSFGSNGILSGTPTTPGSYTFGVTVTDSSGGTASTAASIVVKPAPLNISSRSPLSSGINTVEYPSIQLAATGGTTPYKWSLSSGALPPGMTFDSGGTLSGTPTSAGGFTLGVTVTDAANATATSAFSLTIRPVTADLILSAGSVGFDLTTGATTPPAGQTITVQSSVIAQQIGYSVQISPTVPWLSVSSGNNTPGSISIALNSAALALTAGSYSTTVRAVCGTGTCTGTAQSVNVSLNVTSPPPRLKVGTDLLSFSATTQALSPQSAPISLQNVGGGSLGVASVTCQATWCTAGTPPASIPGSGSANVNITVNPSASGVGFFRTTADIVTSAGRGSVPVTLFVAANSTLTLAPSGTQFSAPQGGAPGNGSGSFLVSVNSTTPVNLTASQVGSSPWLKLSGSSFSASSAQPANVTYSIDSAAAAALTPGAYYEQISIGGPGLSNAPQTFQVILNITPATETAKPDPQPAGLLFLATAGAGNPPTQTVTVFTSSTRAQQFQASATSDSGWLSVNPGTGSTSQPSPASTSVTANITGLRPGVYTGQVSYSFAGSGVRTVNVTLVVSPVAGNAASALTATATGPLQPRAGCTPGALAPVQTGLVSNFSAPTAWPTPLALKLVDDCGAVVRGAQIVATFTNGDPPMALPLIDPGNGLYSGTWTPRRAVANLTINARVTASGFREVSTQLVGKVTPNAAPLLTPRGTVHAFSPLVGAPLAPGNIAAVYGDNLAVLTGVPDAVPLPTSVNGTQVLIGGVRAPIYFTSPGQVNAQIPFELEPDKQYQVIVSANGALSTPDLIQLTKVVPGIAAYADGTAIAQHGDGTLITAKSPAKAGEIAIAYLSGLGAPSTDVASGGASPSGNLATPAVIPTLTVGGRDSKITFVGLTPGLVGLYQMNFEVPAGITSGNPAMIVKQSDVTSAPVLLPYAP